MIRSSALSFAATSRHILSAVLLLSAAFALYFAFTGYREEKRFLNPIAFTFFNDKLYVIEKENNTLLELEHFAPNEPMILKRKFQIENDDDQYYYMVRKMYPAPDGLVVHSYIYRRESKEFVGYRLNLYESLDTSPVPILTIFPGNPKDYPEIAFSFDREGYFYLANNCASHRNIWKMPADGGVVIGGGKIPPTVLELGERNKPLDKWESIGIGPEGDLYVSCGATGKISEYSAKGEKVAEVGTSGFSEGDLLAPVDVFFMRMEKEGPECLTVASPGNRTWVQFDHTRNVTRVISPLKAGYPFRDILTGRIYQDKKGAQIYSFDLVNKNLIIFKPALAVSTTYTARIWSRTAILSIVSLMLTIVALFLRRISSCLRQLRIPFFFKMLALFVSLLAVSAYVVGDSVRDIMKVSSDAESARRSANLARAVINNLSLSDLREIQKPGDREGLTYERIYQTVSSLVDQSVDQTPKWILHKIHDGRFYFGINIWRGAIYQPFIVPADRRIFFKVLEDKTCEHGRFRDEQGEWFSYLCPIIDEGKVTYVLELYRPAEQLDRAEREAEWQVGEVVGLTVVAAAALIFLFSYLFTRPLRSLIRGTQVISGGDFDHPIEVFSHDELGDLAGAFNQMLSNLKKYTVELARTTAEKESIQSELRLAREMQQEILPRSFPPFPKAEGIEIFAKMDPAREVGGDYYDFFMIDDTHIGVVVADVSGKGVPAGLFMMRTRAALRSSTLGNCSAAAAMDRVNQVIVADNPSLMFVTMFYFVCDMKTGIITFCNAGHNPPILLKNGMAEMITTGTEDGGGIPIGISEEAVYSDREIKLSNGDILAVYTDGITDSVDVNGEMFGEERLMRVLETHAYLQPRDLCNALLCEVNEHQRNLDKFDDITLLFFKLSGNKSIISES